MSDTDNDRDLDYNYDLPDEDDDGTRSVDDEQPAADEGQQEPDDE